MTRWVEFMSDINSDRFWLYPMLLLWSDISKNTNKWVISYVRDKDGLLQKHN